MSRTTCASILEEDQAVPTLEMNDRHSPKLCLLSETVFDLLRETASDRNLAVRPILERSAVDECLAGRCDGYIV